jgi:hypothetical protein
VAELNVGELLGSLEQVGLVTKAVSEDNIAALVNQVCSSLVASVGLGNVLLVDNLRLGKAELLCSALNSLDKVEVVGGCFVVKQDNAKLEIVLRIAAGDHGKAHSSNHQKSQAQGEYSLEHWNVPP